MKQRKGQIAVFLIIGLLLLAVIAAVIYSARKQPVGSKHDSELLKPIKSYITSCLEKNADEALSLAGSQGGVIYKSQGGIVKDYVQAPTASTSSTARRVSDEGAFYLTYNNHIVPYAIMRPRFDIGTIYYASTPDYPWKTFPYTACAPAACDHSKESMKAYLGTVSMPLLRKSEGVQSIEAGIEAYIEAKMPECNLAVFKERFDFEAGTPNATVVVAQNDISIRLKWPIDVRSRDGNAYHLEDFSAQSMVRLKRLYELAKSIARADTGIADFDVRTVETSDSIGVKLVRDLFKAGDAANGDDVIVLTDRLSVIGGRPYSLVIARQNRPPALRYIDANPEVNLWGMITRDAVNPNIRGSKPLAYDPDEDELTLSFIVNPGGQAALMPEEGIKAETRFIYQDNIIVRVKADDSSLADYQDVAVYVNI